jgi:hypothetical protein
VLTLTEAQMQQRMAAVMTAAAEERPSDLIPLLTDLTPGDVGWLLYSLAALSVRAFVPFELREDPDAIRTAADNLRVSALAFAAEAASTNPQETDHG